MTLLKFAIVQGSFLSASSNHCLGRRSVGEQHPEDLLVHRESVLQLVNQRGLAFKNDIDVITGIELLVGHSAEVSFVHLLDRLNFAACRSDLRGNLVDGIFDTLFFACRLEYEQGFVSFHCAFPSFAASGLFGTPLNWLIAFCIPASSQVSTWSEATVKTLSIRAASVELNLPSTWPVISRAL